MEIWTAMMKKAIWWFANAELIEAIYSDSSPCDAAVQMVSVASGPAAEDETENETFPPSWVQSEFCTLWKLLHVQYITQ